MQDQIVYADVAAESQNKKIRLLYVFCALQTLVIIALGVAYFLSASSSGRVLVSDETAINSDKTVAASVSDSNKSADISKNQAAQDVVIPNNYKNGQEYFVSKISEMGFRLRFPKSWNDLRITLNSEKNQASFALPKADGTYKVAFVIADYNPCQTASNACNFTVLKNAKFYAEVVQDNQDVLFNDVESLILPSLSVFAASGDGWSIPELSLEIPISSSAKKSFSYAKSVNSESFDIIYGKNNCIVGNIYYQKIDAVMGNDYIGQMVGLTDDRQIIYTNAQAPCTDTSPEMEGDLQLFREVLSNLRVINN